MDRRSYPLRKVLERVNNDIELNLIGWNDILECGHVLPTSQDIAGYYYPEKRRCHKCAKGKPADIKIN